MNFVVEGYKTEVFENVHGMEMEEDHLVNESSYQTAEQAERAARELYAHGQVDLIYISHLGGNDFASRYWNPREGISATGTNWVEEFEAQ